jgi:serine/threonine-protein kinase PpkA
MQRNRSTSLAALFGLFSLLATVQAEQWVLNEKLVAIDGNPSIPLRLVTKPGAKIYKERNMKDDQFLSSPVAFSVFYVSQNKSGNTKVYQVAYETGEPLGFIAEEQVLEWRTSLCLKFDSPNGRQPVLMFKDSATLTQLASKPTTQRASLVKSWYSTIDGLGASTTVPDDFPVLSMEPKRGVDMKRNFYLMPALDHVELDFGTDENENPVTGLGVQVSIASKTGARGATNLENKKYVQGTVQEGNLANAGKAPVEIVFCFDLTNSMQPFINVSLDLARQIAGALNAEPEAAGRLHFGLWGYRDEGKEAEGFVVHAFTPQPVAIDQFNMALSQAKASGKTGGDVPEDLLGGFMQATQQGFTPDAGDGSQESRIRVLVLIGDAPGHDSPADPRNSSRQSLYQLRELASSRHINVYSIHIKDPRYEQFQAPGEMHFKALATNPGVNQSSFSQITINANGDNSGTFTQAAQGLFNYLRKDIILAGQADKQAAEKRRQEEAAALLSEEERKARDQANAVVNDLFQAAMVDWIARNSKDVQAPNDITAWISDHDLDNPQRLAVQTCVLLSRNDLDSLNQALKVVMEAALEGRTSGKEFFACIQNVAATASVIPTKVSGMKEMKTLSDLKLLPGFLQALPYKSKLLKLTNDDWSSMPVTKRQKMIDDLQGLIDAYKKIYADNEQWVSLTENRVADDSTTVAAVPLTLLP